MQWNIYKDNQGSYAVTRQQPHEGFAWVAGPFTPGEAHSWMLDNVAGRNAVGRQPMRAFPKIFQYFHYFFG